MKNDKELRARVLAWLLHDEDNKNKISNQELLDEENFKELYDRLNDVRGIGYGAVGALTSLLLEIGGWSITGLMKELRFIPTDFCYGIESLPSHLVIPVEVRGEMGAHAFSHCYSLESVEVLGGSTIGWYAFSDCSSLKKIDIGVTIKEIEGGAFAQCTSLESITIPRTVKSVGDAIFEECTNLKEVRFECSEEESRGWYSWDGDMNDSVRIIWNV